MYEQQFNNTTSRSFLHNDIIPMLIEYCKYSGSFLTIILFFSICVFFTRRIFGNTSFGQAYIYRTVNYYIQMRRLIGNAYEKTFEVYSFVVDRHKVKIVMITDYDNAYKLMKTLDRAESSDIHVNCGSHPFIHWNLRDIRKNWNKTAPVTRSVLRDDKFLGFMFNKLIECQSLLLNKLNIAFNENNGKNCYLNKVLDKYMINVCIVSNLQSPESSDEEIETFRNNLLVAMKALLKDYHYRYMDFNNALLTRSINDNTAIIYDTENFENMEYLTFFKQTILNEIDLKYKMYEYSKTIVPYFIEYLMNIGKDNNLHTFSKENIEDKLFNVDDINGYIFLNMSSHLELIRSTILFCIIELAVNPKCQKLLQNELDSLIQFPLKIGWELKKFDDTPYLNNCIYETLRKYPPVPFIIRKYVRKEGTSRVNRWILMENQFCVIPILHFHRNPTLFKNPLKFKPNRFLLGPQQYHPYYLPFGYGGRFQCPAMKLAFTNVKMALITIFSKYYVTLDDTLAPEHQCYCYEHQEAKINLNCSVLKPLHNVMVDLHNRHTEV